MHKDHTPIAVTSRSFSRSAELRQQLESRYANVCYNNTDHSLKGDELIEFLQGKEKAIIALEKIDHKALEQLPELKVIAKYGVGVNNLELEALKKHGVGLGWTPGVNARSVSELVICFMLGFSRNVFHSRENIKDGIWKVEGGNLLSGKTIGIVGCGNVGKDLIRLLQPFGCRILVNDIREYKEFFQEFSIETVTKEQLLQRADFVTLHIPFNKQTENFIAAQELNLMKPSATLINTSRGGIVNETELLSWLRDNPGAAAALDVFNNEPFLDSPLLTLKNFYSTPHIGGSAREAIQAMGAAAINGLDEFSNDIDAVIELTGD